MKNIEKKGEKIKKRLDKKWPSDCETATPQIIYLYNAGTVQ